MDASTHTRQVSKSFILLDRTNASEKVCRAFKIREGQFIVIIMLCTVLTLFSFSHLLAQVELQYQNRGSWYEGIKPKPVSGYDIELISVLVDYQEMNEAFPEKVKLRFYSEQEADVFLTVRELDYRHYYWLDRVTLDMTWKAGSYNAFEWETGTVLRQLSDSFGLYDLGVVARLGKETPSATERVLPAILFHSQLPKTVNGYRFTLKTGGDARLFCKIFKEGVDEPIDTQVYRRKRGGRPFTITWDASQATPGNYRLVITGFFLNTNAGIKAQTIRFYHQPTPPVQ
ncbi:hypothetical protein [Candidatus Nitrospira salsa]